MNSFADFNFHDDLMKSLKKIGFDTPTEIQAQFIPLALKGLDVMASAQTGSGKTAAFLLPSFQSLLDIKVQKSTSEGSEASERNQTTTPKAKSKNKAKSRAMHNKCRPRMLVLTPTRELAEQVMKVATSLRAFTDLSVKSVVGGVPIMKHKRMFREHIDVLVATPGRLIDLMMQGCVELNNVEIFVIDEADRMLDMGFSTDVLKISRAIGDNRQTMLLSATFDGRVAPIIKDVMDKPTKIELTHAKHTHENITQCLYRATDMIQKKKILHNIIKDQNIWQAVIFAGTKRLTEKLAKELQGQGENADFLHGDMRQSSRNKVINKMKDDELRFLVATDVAARGLDIKQLTHVINFDIPRNSEDYIHRIGRVGRAGKTGDAISIVSNEQWGLLKDVEHLIGVSIEQKTVEGIDYTPPKALAKGAKFKAGGKKGKSNANGKGKPKRKSFAKSDDKSEGRGKSERGEDRKFGRNSNSKSSGGNSSKNLDSRRREKPEPKIMATVTASTGQASTMTASMGRALAAGQADSNAGSKISGKFNSKPKFKGRGKPAVKSGGRSSGNFSGRHEEKSDRSGKPSGKFAGKSGSRSKSGVRFTGKDSVPAFKAKSNSRSNAKPRG